MDMHYAINALACLIMREGGNVNISQSEIENLDIDSAVSVYFNPESNCFELSVVKQPTNFTDGTLQ